VSDDKPKTEKYSFKHDTDNLTTFTVVVFSIASLMITIALTLLFTRYMRDSIQAEYDKDGGNFQQVKDLRKYEEKNSKGIDEAMNRVISEYNE
jgi:hypothetical protein